MSNLLKVNRVTTHKHTLYYVPESEKDSENPMVVTCTALSYRQLLDLNFFIENNMFNELYLEVVRLSVTSLSNVVINNQLTSSTDSSILPYSIAKEIAEFILEKSKVSDDNMDSVGISYDIIADKRFKSDTYNCSVCQAKNLDKIRNCGKLGEQEKNKDFYLMVGDTKFTHCPIFDIDSGLLSDALTCYKYYTDGFLPDPGSLYDQTEFFITTSSLLTNKVKEEEARQYEEMKRKH